MTESSTDKPRIVVGVDGSASSKSALGWAAAQARLTGATVEAVITWELPPNYGYGGYVSEDDLSDWARKTLAESVEEEVADGGAVDIRQEVRRGHAALVLIDAAKGADLLVVGSRGHGGFTGALLGSVSQHCAQHASCPVVIVREKH